MRGTPASSDLGRHVFGAAALATGLITLAWHRPAFAYAAAAGLILGGVAIQFRRTEMAGAAILAAAYLFFVSLCVPGIVAAPQTYASWGNFFEQLSLGTGAAIAYARVAARWAPETLDRIGRTLMGICTASFTLEQAIYLDSTAKLVPKWIAPSQTFWAVTTTALFALAAVALLTNRMALPATRLLTLMILIFGIVVWVPLVLSSPHDHADWSEIAETFAIAGAVWILADLLGEHRFQEKPAVHPSAVPRT